MSIKQLRDASVAFQRKDYGECLKVIGEKTFDTNSSRGDMEMNIKIGTMKGLSYYNLALPEQSSSIKKKELFNHALQAFDQTIMIFKDYGKLLGDSNYLKGMLGADVSLNVIAAVTKVYYLGGVCLLQNNSSQALDYFTNAIHLATTVQRGMNNVSNRILAKSIIQEIPKYFFNRAICYNESESYALAEKDLLRYIVMVETSEMTSEKQAPLLFMAFTNLATSKSNQKQDEEAIKHLNRAIELFNTMDKDVQQIHFQNFVTSKLQRAIILEKFITENIHACKSDEKIMNIIENYRKVASDDLETVRKHKKLSFNLIYQYVQMVLLFCKQLEGTMTKEQLYPLYCDAASKLEECLSAQPKNAALYGDLASCKGKIGEGSIEDILVLYNKCISLSNGEPTDNLSKKRLARIFFERSVIQYKLSNTELTLKDLDKAIHLNPYFSDAYYNRGFLLRESDLEQSLDDLGATCELNLNDVECVILTAVLLAKQGNKEGARSIIQEFINFNPDSSELKDFIISLDDEEKLSAFKSLSKFREAYQDVKLWTPKRRAKRVVDKSLGTKKKRKADLNEADIDSEDGLFVDKSFPATQLSIYGKGESELPSGLIWLRPKDLACLEDEPKLFVEGCSYKDIVQGQLGDCWLLSAFSIIAEYPELMQKIILESQCEPSNGKYVFSFFKEGSFREVVIDDRLPCEAESKQLVFSSSSTYHEMWLPLLEKGFAALYGCYEALEGGHLSEALVDLTGGIPFSIELNEKKKEIIWEHLQSLPKKSPHQTSYKLLGARSEKAPEKTGLMTFHAYAILDAYEIPEEISNGKRIRLLKIKNPWGNTEWKGEYSDKSKLWTPEIREFVQYGEKSDDGVFFMTLESFVKHFDLMEGTQIFDKMVWNEAVFRDEFKSKPEGDNEDWLLDVCQFAPQYVIKNEHKNNKIYITLSQRDQRYTTDKKEEECCVAVHLFNYPQDAFKGEESCKVEEIGENDTLVEGVYCQYRDVLIEYELQEGCYVTIPNEYYVKKSPPEPYCLRIISEKPIETVRLN